MAVTQAGAPAAMAVQNGNNSISLAGTWGTGQNRTAGNRLVAVVSVHGESTGGVISGPGGIWASAVATSDTFNNVAVFTAVAAGGDAAPTFTATVTGTAAGATGTLELFELTDPAGTPIVSVSGVGGNTSATLAVTTTGNVPGGGCYAVSGFLGVASATGAQTWTSPAPWANQDNDGSQATVHVHTAVDVQVGPAAGATLSETSNWSNAIRNVGVILVLAPAAGRLPLRYSAGARVAVIPVLIGRTGAGHSL